MMQNGAEPKPERILELDALRGIGAIAVLLCHLPREFWFGETGVDLFFVLSGFLITGILLRSVGQPQFLRTFYLRRSLRIFPVYYLALASAYGLNHFRPTPAETTGFPFYLVYLQHIHEYWGASTPPANISLNHTWSLAIEEQFYLFWPLAFVLLKRPALIWLGGICLVAPVFFRYMGLPKLVLLGHTEGMALGALLAWLTPATASIPRYKRASVYAAIAIAGFAVYWALYWKLHADTPDFNGKAYLAGTLSISIISLAYFGLIGFVVCMAGSPRLSMLRNKVLLRVGTISYGLYLYHWVIYEYLDALIKFRWGLGDPWWLDVLKLAVSFAVATASWRLIEQPILRFKEGLGYEGKRRTSLRSAPLSAAGVVSAHD